MGQCDCAPNSKAKFVANGNLTWKMSHCKNKWCKQTNSKHQRYGEHQRGQLLCDSRSRFQLCLGLMTVENIILAKHACVNHRRRDASEVDSEGKFWHPSKRHSSDSVSLLFSALFLTPCGVLRPLFRARSFLRGRLASSNVILTFHTLTF